ncbi:MAG: right-handed parallel beta-helix repeat-containing protein [Cyclobacteriaceae bacterium]
MFKALPFVAILLIWASCSTVEDNVSFDPNLEILFSNDSVAFDTLLSDSRSATQRLVIFNPNENALVLSEIFLGKDAGSDYSIIVNGKEGKGQLNEQILGGDSLMILVEANISPRNQNTPYLVKDSIIFNWNGNSEHVKLVAWGQDGNRLQSQVVGDVTWTNDRPYVISDTVLVRPNSQLTIEAGTIVFFENDAALFVQGSLVALGDAENHILFRNARFDGIYDQVPGQWNGIYFLEGSASNQIEYAEIFNGQVGLRVGSPDDDAIPDLVVSNTQIYNMSSAGILAFTSDLIATNCLIYNCGSYLIGNFAGGNYTYQHCTFSNDQSFFVHNEPSVQFSDNILIGENELLTDNLTIEMTNCIVWGSQGEELLINTGGDAIVSAILTTNIIRSGEEIPGNFVSQTSNFPGFSNRFLFDYSLDTLAFAQNKGTAIGVNFDISGESRDAIPDIGAFERIDNK